MTDSSPRAAALARIVITAALFGAVGLLGGVIIPGIRDPTTVQGPLLGIFMTGPLGFFVGGNIGIVWSAWARKRTTLFDVAALAVFAFVDLLLYEFFAVIGAAFVTIVPAVAFVVTGVTAAALLKWANTGRRLRSALVVVPWAAPLLLVTALFPPVTRNPLWHRVPLSATPPHFRFVLNGDLDTRSRVPPLTIDLRILHLEWAAALALAMATVRLRPAVKSAINAPGSTKGLERTRGGPA